MKKNKKRFIIFSSLFLLLLLLAISSFLIYKNRKKLFPQLFPIIRGDIHVFGKPNAKADYTFPTNKPQYTAHVTSLQSSSLQQQSVTIYHSSDKNKTPVFQRQFYADEFRGRMLTYSFASDSASFRQSGSLGTIGCSSNECALVWSNFYMWDPQQNTFVLTNAAHKDFFQQLLISYQAIDKSGCSLIGTATLPTQTGISFSQLYTKYPRASWYCSQSQGILPTNLMFFLKAKKAIQEGIDGKNIGTDDINDVSL